ncbi:hypothetical protein AAX05_03310 [Moraxella bovoculi]|uniref:hypothetical protein n=1 Tax=Moraxella bovoculi TaxID=386891 RepID=UPI00062438E4|nr:hypothetical protein [Moraxella bovoculi]AKG09363.1 hypothetical protein AAX05_03310 [Moraxella bovoculi]AKG12250.1 hypothetical protein AAX07_10070 [Moraxella bovoculi]AKG13189.1 hypothetical protein AAX11_03060 [Moraxella bovoculi]AKG14221.1 hypothetical protein AAX11_09605 [Moraxella bovoculi]
MSEQNLTTLTRIEARTLQSFISQIDFWRAQHGDKADIVEIVYYPEDEGFEVASNEANNGISKRNRASVFRTELLSWAANQLRDLQGWDKSNTVTAFSVSYKDDTFGVAVEVVPTASLGSKTEPTDELADEEA